MILTVLMLLLLLLSRFSRVRLCATPQSAAHQAPPSLGFSRQEHWSGLHFLLQCMKVKRESEVAQLCPTLSDPMDCSPPGSSVHGIFQARVLEWGAIAFSIFMLLATFYLHSSHLITDLFPPGLYLESAVSKMCHFNCFPLFSSSLFLRI